MAVDGALCTAQEAAAEEAGEAPAAKPDDSDAPAAEATAAAPKKRGRQRKAQLEPAAQVTAQRA